MLEITPCLDSKQLAVYCRKCAAVCSPAHYLYLATNGDKQLAAALFEVESNRVSVLLYESDELDPFLFDAVLRAGLNYASGHGIETGYLPEAFRELHKARFDKLNYPHDASFNITNFFAKYKICGS